MFFEFGESLTDLMDSAENFFGYELGPDNDEIWDIVKGQDKMPNFYNIYIGLFFSNLIEEIKQYFDDNNIGHSVDFFTDINGPYASSISFRTNPFESYQDITDVEAFLSRFED